MIALLAIYLAQIGMPFSMVAGGAVPGATPTPTPTPTPGTVVATPAISPASGSDLPVSISITCATSGATIFYTLSNGGTTPSHNGATPLGSTLVYHGGFSVSGNQPKVVEALGYKSGLTDSAVRINTYQPSGGGGQ